MKTNGHTHPAASNGVAISAAPTRARSTHPARPKAKKSRKLLAWEALQAQRAEMISTVAVIDRKSAALGVELHAEGHHQFCARCGEAAAEEAAHDDEDGRPLALVLRRCPNEHRWTAPAGSP